MQCECKIVMRNGNILDTSMGNVPCSEVSRIELCPLHDAACDLLAALDQAIMALDNSAIRGYPSSGATESMRSALAKAKGE
jgi:hypothetical protein